MQNGTLKREGISIIHLCNQTLLQIGNLKLTYEHKLLNLLSNPKNEVSASPPDRIRHRPQENVFVYSGNEKM
jgi:hypothetical protein